MTKRITNTFIHTNTTKRTLPFIKLIIYSNRTLSNLLPRICVYFQFQLKYSNTYIRNAISGINCIILQIQNKYYSNVNVICGIKDVYVIYIIGY